MSALEDDPGPGPDDEMDLDPWGDFDVDPYDPDAATEPEPEPLSIRDELERALVSGRRVLDLPPPEPLVEDMFDVGGLSTLFGKSGSGKSFVALDWSLCIASGNWWQGHKVKRGPVLYVAAEGQTGLGIRAKAWAVHNRTTIPDAMTWLIRPANLLNHQAAHALADIGRDLGAVLVVIDTLNRSMPGGEENQSKDMGLVIAACDLIRRATGAHVQLVHHTGKDATAGARGHSSLNGAVDTELEVKNGGDGIITLTSSKQKEAPTGGLPLRLALVPAADSVAIGRYSSRIEEGAGLTSTGHLCLDALHKIALPGGAPTTVWRDAAVDAGASRTMAYEQIKKLTELGLVHNLGSDARPAWALTPEALELKGEA
jgi:hypothetical protein